jgi:multidrug efflux pump subunit AcrB
MNPSRPAFSPFPVIVVFLALMIIGTAFIPMLDVRFKPDRDLPRLSVRFSWPNASPQIIEQEASKIEGILGKINQVQSIESTSSVGNGLITLNFDKTANLDQKRYEVSMLIRQLRSSLPPQMSYPEISSVPAQSDNQTSFMVLTLNSAATTFQIGKTAEQFLIPELLKIKGIGDVNLFGITPHQWEIIFDPQLLDNFDVTPADISTTVNQLGSNEFLGNQHDGFGALLPVLSTVKQIPPDKWERVPVSNKNGRIIFLGDVASVRLKEQPPASYYRINGQNTINLVLHSAPGENQLRLSSMVRQQLAAIVQKFPPGYSVQVASDSTLFIKNELTKIGWRTFFSLLILLLFVLVVSRSFRILGILFLALMANLLIACAFYYLFKIEIHIYSLAAITVSFGIIIDNSIIMVTHLQKQKGMRVFIALLAATLTTLGALSVVFFLKENQKILLVDFTWVMLINLSVSLLVSFFLVPALMQNLYHKVPKPMGFRKRKWVIYFTSLYSRFIRFEKRYKWAFIMLIVLAFGLPVKMLPDKMEGNEKIHSIYNKTFGHESFKTNIMPIMEKVLGGTLRLFSEHVYEGGFYTDPGRTTLYVRGSMPEGCTVHQLNEAVRKMEQYISQFEEIEQFETRVTGYNNSSIVIRFNPEAEASSFPYLLKSQVEGKAISLGGMDWSVYGVGRGFSNALNMDYKNSRILLTGYNYNQLYAYAEQLEEKLLAYERVRDTEIASSQTWFAATRFEYNLEVDKDLLASQELSYSDYTGSFFTQLYERNLQPFYNHAELQPVVLLSERNRAYNKWDFYHRPVATQKGSKKLSFGGTIEKRLTGKSIYKKNQVYQVYLNYNFIGPAPLATMIQDREILAFNQILPLGFKAERPQSMYYWSAREKKQYWLLLLIMVIIYFITAILFESLVKPLAVMSLIPFSFIGVFLTFYLFGFNFDQGGFASFILLSGLVVNAAIYIINDFNNLVERKKQAISVRTYLKAFNQKIVAIMLTILSTVLGLVPFVWGGQTEVFWFAFAAGAMGGLVFSLVAIIMYLPLFLKLKDHAPI